VAAAAVLLSFCSSRKVCEKRNSLPTHSEIESQALAEMILRNCAVAVLGSKSPLLVYVIVSQAGHGNDVCQGKDPSLKQEEF
jgi:hypothetical protein